MKKFVLLLAAIMCLQAVALAVPHNVITGPYNISFDLGLPKDVSIIAVEEPVKKEKLNGDVQTEYSIKVTNETGVTRLIMIKLVESDIKIKLTGEEMAMSMRSYLPANGFKNIESSARIIDMKDGAVSAGDSVAAGMSFKAYQASYYPTNNTTVFLTSSFPWDEGTLQLLKTIHIGMVNATA